MTTQTYFFYNFTDKPFTGYWNGKAYTFKPGVKKEYPRLIARHFAKHLTNQILIETGEEQYTSPKKPDEVPAFMAIFKKAFLVQEVADEDNLDIDSGGKDLHEQPSMNIETKARESVDPYDASENPMTPPGPSQTIDVPVPEGDEGGDDDSEESEYAESGSDGKDTES